MKTMRPQRAVLPLAFLSAAFMLGCEDSRPTPVGPEGLGPQFHAAHPLCEAHKKNDAGCNVDATFAAVLTGDVDGAGDLIGPNGGKNTLQTRFGEDFVLTLPAVDFQDKVDFGRKCFGDEQFNQFNAIMIVGQKKPGDPTNASILLFFEANDTAGNFGINYVLTLLDAEFTAGPWPPADDAPATINGGGGKFTLAHANGPGNKDGCKVKEEVDLDFELCVEVSGDGNC